MHKSSLPINTASEIDYDVIIVGAGPVGLATAIGLRQRGITNIMVLDQTRSFRKVGQGIDLLPNGLKALKYLDVQAYKNIQNVGQKFNNFSSPRKKSLTWTSKNVKGEIIRSVPLDYEEYQKKYGEGRVSLGWYDLQTQLRNLLPAESIQVNHRCINVVEQTDSSCIRADFISNREIEENPYSHWQYHNQNNIQTSIDTALISESKIKSIRAKLLVAADGINSTVRRIIYKNTPYSSYQKPEYTGFVAISSGGFIKNIPEILAQQIKTQFLGESRVVTIVNDREFAQEMPRIILFCPHPHEFTYLIHTSLPLEVLANKSGQELINLALDELKQANFPDTIQQLVALCPTEQIVQRPYYIHPAHVSGSAEPQWHQGRIVLVGDAAHGMPPFMAQGVNQGLEDAATIVTLITNIIQQHNWDNLPAIQTAFVQYESFRRPLVNMIQQATLTRIPLSSKEKWEQYCQQVYNRNLEELLCALNI